ncbi:MAG: MtrB/PioB family decaheme-associated outer membrane protein [Woeseiaceae bacterium]
MKTLSRAIALALVAPAAAWADADTSEWACEFCPFEEGYTADMSVGATYVSDDAARFGNGTGYDEKGGYINLDGEGRYAKDGKQMRWAAEDLGLKSRVLSIEAGSQGHYTYGLEYRELPYRRFDTTQTVYTESGDALQLPSGWVTAPLTSGFTQLAASLGSRNIETDRQILKLDGEYLPSTSFALFADYRRQQRDGVAITTGSTYTQAAYLPRPIDDHTDEMNLGVRYKAENFNMALAYFGSYYRNSVDSLTWDNPFTSFPGADQGRTAVEPDNDFQQVSFSGAYFAETMRTNIVFSAAMGRGEQTATLLPYTINPTLSPPSLPVSSLDGKVDTSNYTFTITSRPFDKARVSLTLRQDERDNKTPVSMWSRVITDNVTSGDTEFNTAYSFKRQKLNLAASYRLFSSLKLSAGYDRGQLDRDYQEVAEQTEDTGWGKLDYRPNNVFDITLRGGASRREIDRYDTDVAISLGQNPLMRKYNLAYRYREFGELTAAVSFPSAPVSLAVTVMQSDDSYSRSELGMTASDEMRVTGDISWAVGERTSIYLSGGVDSIEATQLGSEDFGAADWTANHDDSFMHAGGGFRVLGIGDKADLEFDYTRSEGETDIAVSRYNNAPDNLPTLDSTMDSLRMNLSFTVSERLATTFSVRYERFKTSDWALDGVQVDTLPTVLTMGASSYDYDVWAAGIGFRYSIGAD